MVREKLKKYFSDRGFNEVNLHTSDMDLFYVNTGSSASLIWIISEEARRFMNKDAYDRYYNKIRQSFADKNFLFVNTLTLFLTSECRETLELATGTAFWVVDEKYGRVVIYENQPDDFLGIRLQVEQFVSYLTTERVREAEQIRQEEEERLRRETYQDNLNRRNIRTADRNRNVRYSAAGTDRKPYVIFGLIIINCIVLFLVNLLGDVLDLSYLLNDGAVSWMAVFDDGEYYRLFTCMFLHAGIDHIVGNMIVLYAAGELLERAAGHISVILIYIGGGLMGSVTSCLYYYSTHQYIESIGASGAVFAVVGGLIMYMILNRASLMGMGAVRIILFACYALYSGFINQGVDNAAHVGGLMGGSIIYLLIFLINNLREKSGNRKNN
ncbi:MAG: rhomboid family intramembrane serine protease [Lachnospiraceae bacterium]